MSEGFEFVASNKILFLEKEEADNLFIIKQGRVKTFKNINGRIHIIAVKKKGDFIGQHGLFSKNKIRKSNCFVEGDLQVVKISYQEMKEVLDQGPLWVQKLMESLVVRSEALSEALEEHQIRDEDLDLSIDDEEEQRIFKAISEYRKVK